jgi:hypothetical protein
MSTLRFLARIAAVTRMMVASSFMSVAVSALFKAPLKNDESAALAGHIEHRGPVAEFHLPDARHGRMRKNGRPAPAFPEGTRNARRLFAAVFGARSSSRAFSLQKKSYRPGWQGCQTLFE